MMTSIQDIVITHYKKYLGEPSDFFEDDEIKILEYINQPELLDTSISLNTFLSLGLSNLLLQTNDKHKPFLRMELIMSYDKKYLDFPARNLIYNLSRWIRNSNRMPLSGEIIHLNREVFKGYPFEKLLCFQPIYTNPNFSPIVLTDNKEVVFLIWLIPITKEEAAKIANLDYESFAELFYDHEPNVFDLERLEFDFI
jgi:hypothetical protein